MVSLIIPCLNEARFIGKCLDSILTNGFPLDQLEVLVVDGMSTDGTTEIIHSYANQYSQIRVLHNPNKATPYALNIGIRETKGDMLMRIDAHTTCEKDYISLCVAALHQYSADDVGGTQRVAARDDTFVGRAITKALTQRIGVGNLRYRLSEPRQAESSIPCHTSAAGVSYFRESLPVGSVLEK